MKPPVFLSEQPNKRTKCIVMYNHVHPDGFIVYRNHAFGFMPLTKEGAGIWKPKKN